MVLGTYTFIFLDNSMRFKEIFQGMQSAYGQYVIGEQATNGNKQDGKAFIKRKQVTDDLWQDHLDGKDPALGIIPINEENKCKWGCIDVDKYNLDHKKIIETIRKNNLPLILFRSKSGGAHIFLFCNTFISAALMQSKLKQIAELLGYMDCEIFPKQTEVLVERGDTGNFLNLPYHNHTKGLRYAFNDNGTAATLEEFFELYDIYVQEEIGIDEIKVEKPKQEEVFKDGPPCLNKLANDGFGEGGRNNALFNIAMFYKQAEPDKWEDLVEDANINYMSPPLRSSEVQQLLKSIGKKGYDKYRCKQAPINSVCNSSLCRLKKFGVGFDEEEMPPLNDLTKITSDPPQWFLNVDGKRLKFTTEQLHSAHMFSIACMSQASLIVPIPKSNDWRTLLKELMKSIQEIEPMESLSAVNQLENLLYEFTVNRAQARTKEDILNKTPWTDEGYTYFKMDDFYNWSKKNNWELDKTKTGNLMMELSCYEGEVRSLSIKGTNPRITKIKSLKIIKPSVSDRPYKETNY